MNNRTSGWKSGGLVVLAIVAIVSVTAGAWAGALMANSFAAQPDAPAVQPQEEDAPSGVAPAMKDENGNPIIVVEGIIDGRGSFLFDGNTVQYRHSAYDPPFNVTVNGAPWDDLKKPLKLGFTVGDLLPEIQQSIARNPVSLGRRGKSRFELQVNDFDLSSARYRVQIVLRERTQEEKEKEEEAAKSTRENKAEETTGPTDKPWGPTPPENNSESPAPGLKKNVTDPDHGFTDYESWLAMMQASAVHWNEPTDGQKHPQVSMTSGHETSSPIGQNVRKGEKPVTITLSATVDKEALFEFNKDIISYRPFRSTLPAGASGEGKIYAFEGDYPVNVSVNGILWRNLRNYFKLDYTPNLKTLGGMELTQGDVTFLCRYSESFGNSRLVLEIFNRGEKPVPVQIKLTTTAPEKQETK